jgi:diguanylate cyclase (GGDEF)-like protein/PAS domain S-box-containing protein
VGELQQRMARHEERGNEAQRLATLRRFAVLDTPAEHVFDRVTALIARLFDAPMAFISLIDEQRQWFKSKVGSDAAETERALAFCEYAIRSGEVMVVPDATLDPRFRDNALVLGGPKIRFYAGAPLIASDGMIIGTVCVLDRVPRSLNETQLGILRELSAFVMADFELRLEMLETAAVRNELAAIIDASPNAIITGLLDGTITGWNDAARRIFGWRREEVVGRPHSFVPPEFDDEAKRIRTRIIERGEIITSMRAIGLHKSGRHLELAFSAKPICDRSGRAVSAAYVVEDVTESRRAREIERRRYEILELAANDAPLQEILDGLVQSIEYSIPESMGSILHRRGDRLFHAASGAAIAPAYISAIDGLPIGPSEGSCGTAAFRGEMVIVSDIARDPLWEKYRVVGLAHGLRSCWSAPIRNGQNQILGTLAIYSREMRKPTTSDLRFLHEAAHVASIAIEGNDARARLEEMALHDALTELPNRAYFEQRLDQAIESARIKHKKVALGMLDLNRFKLVNDSLGHAAGDQLLKEIANRLHRSIRPGDTLARMSGDEFLFLIADIDDRAMAETIARRLTATLEESFMPAGHEIFVRASIGVSIYPDDAREPSQLLRLADGAMYAAKARGDTIGFYAGPQRHDGLTRLALEAHLNHALENDEFELYYQPQLRARTGETFGAEALLRWNHPQLGLVMPDSFIRLAEETGLIVSIGAWVLEEACRFGRRWLDLGGPGVVSVNVSPRQFESGDFVGTVVAALERSGLTADRLWLEITESLIMRSPETAASMIADLRAMGVRSFIDDFGTGYSSLNHLKRFPIDGLKIDQTFLRDIGGPLKTGNDAVLVRAILSVGRAMNLTIVAEGVETQAQYDFLIARRCDIVQGFLFAKPMPEAELLAWRAPTPA